MSKFKSEHPWGSPEWHKDRQRWEGYEAYRERIRTNEELTLVALKLMKKLKKLKFRIEVLESVNERQPSGPDSPCSVETSYTPTTREAFGFTTSGDDSDDD